MARERETVRAESAKTVTIIDSLLERFRDTCLPNSMDRLRDRTKDSFERRFGDRFDVLNILDNATTTVAVSGRNSLDRRMNSIAHETVALLRLHCTTDTTTTSSFAMAAKTTLLCAFVRTIAMDADSPQRDAFTKRLAAILFSDEPFNLANIHPLQALRTFPQYSTSRVVATLLMRCCRMQQQRCNASQLVRDATNILTE